VPSIAERRCSVLADSWTAETAQIVAVKPDLVIASVPYQEKAVAEIMKAGSRFLGLAPKSLADVYTDIATIAGTIGANERGEAVIRRMQDHIAQVRDRVGSPPRIRVFCEEWGKPIIASQPWVAELVDAAGGKFLSEAGKTVSREAIWQADPEVIIAAWCGAGDRVPLEKIIRERGWEQTSAAKKGCVFCIRDEFLNTPAPTLLAGLDALCWAIHPEVFPRTKGIRQITGVPASTAENVAR
jgi:iron complex transport system substrate-binding protein